MDLQQTVSKILGREVSVEEAKNFAHEQYGVICAFNRKWEKEVKPKPSYYQQYLFSQLFHATLKDCDIEGTPYDILFPIIQNELEKFLNSDYNDENYSEYDCMADYLQANEDTISLQIADHVNL